jgi:hypothetical protein
MMHPFRLGCAAASRHLSIACDAPNKYRMQCTSFVVYATETLPVAPTVRRPSPIVGVRTAIGECGRQSIDDVTSFCDVIARRERGTERSLQKKKKKQGGSSENP